MMPITFSFVSAICIAISSFALKWSFHANAELKVISNEISNMQEIMDKLGEKSDLDKKQDEQISKFWRLHSWSKTEVNKLRVKNGDDIEDWPDLGNSGEW